MVAERIGRTSPSIYLHFPDKSSLMWAVCARQYGTHDEAMARAVEGVADPLERLRGMGRAYVQFALDHPEEFRILFMTDRSRLGGVRQVGDFEGTPGFDLLTGAIRELVALGHVETADPFRLALDVWAAVHGVATILVAQPTLDWPEPVTWVERVMNQTLYGLLNPAGRAAHPPVGSAADGSGR
jgi:AcrR family transcriptional regulator